MWIFSVRVLASMVLLLLLLCGEQTKGQSLTNPPAIIDSYRIIKEPQLCGLNCLYISMRLLGDKSINYDQLLIRFPKAPTEGLSLNELQHFLVERNIPNELLWMDEREIASLTGGVAIVFIPGIPQNHLVVKYPAGLGLLKIFDPPAILIDKAELDQESKKRPTLLIGKKVNRLFYTLPMVGISFLVLGLVTLICTVSLKKSYFMEAN